MTLREAHIIHMQGSSGSITCNTLTHTVTHIMYMIMIIYMMFYHCSGADNQSTDHLIVSRCEHLYKNFVFWSLNLGFLVFLYFSEVLKQIRN